MVLAVNDSLYPRVLFFSNDMDIRKSISGDSSSPDFDILFVTSLDNISHWLTRHVPQLAIIDLDFDISMNTEIVRLLKINYNLPIILIIDPDNDSQLKQAARVKADSIFIKPFYPQQLNVYVRYYLMKATENECQTYIPHRRDESRKKFLKIKKHSGDSDEYILDKQDFIHKLAELTKCSENEGITNSCILFNISDNNSKENHVWKKVSSNISNLIYRHLETQIRIEDTLARDVDYRYFILFTDMDKYIALQVIRRIIASLSDLLSNMKANGNMKISAGGVVFDNTINMNIILNSLELFLEESRTMDDSSFILKSLLDEKSKSNSKKVSYANIIQNALNNDQFFVHYQPIISLYNNSINHYEALIRLHDSDGNYLSPRNIISVAESNRQIKNIDIRVLDIVMRKLISFKCIPDDLMISINLSGTHFGDESLLQDICVLIDYYGVAPSHLVFEMTETAAVKDLRKASNFISKLNDLGCHFGLDDFGTGYASFSYLRALPVDYLKIDGTFVREIVNNPADQLFVKAIVEVARGLNVKTIAECVEDRETLEMLAILGVDFAQGYFIGRPKPLLKP